MEEHTPVQQVVFFCGSSKNPSLFNSGGVRFCGLVGNENTSGGMFLKFRVSDSGNETTSGGKFLKYGVSDSGF